MSASASSVGGKETQLQMEEAWSPQELTIISNISFKTCIDTRARPEGGGVLGSLGGFVFLEGAGTSLLICLGVITVFNWPKSHESYL